MSTDALPADAPSRRTAPPFDAWFPDAPIDGTYGYDRAALEAVEPPAEPAGFAAQWWRWREQARRQRPEARWERLGRGGPGDDWEISLISFLADGGIRLRGWLALPVSGVVRVGIVHGHGYGGRQEPSFERVPGDAAVIFPVARGLGALNSGIDAPATSREHAVHGLDSLRGSAVGRSAADLWHAADALEEMLLPRAGAVPLYYVGTSFGGGIGALALPWDERYAGATLEVPSFGQHELRETLPCTGSGDAVQQHLRRRPQDRETVALLDSSIAAGHLSIPVRIECALWDAHVPAPGQWAVAGAVARSAPRLLELGVHSAGHAEFPGREAEQQRAWSASREHIARML